MKNETNNIKTLVGAVAIAMSGAAFGLQTDVSTGTMSTLYIENGSVFCSGALTAGQCADLNGTLDIAKMNATYATKKGGDYSRYTPTYIGVDDAKTVDVVMGKGAVLTNAGTVMWFGYNNGTRNFTPVEIDALAGATDISLMGGKLNDADKLFAIINGVAYVYSFATDQVEEIYGVANATAIDADDEHVLILTEAGTLFAAGANESGQLGTGNYNSTGYNDAQPVVDINGLPLEGVTQFSAGHKLSMAVVNGAAYSWGTNRNGALGIGVLDDSITREYADIIADYTGTATNVSTNSATLIQDADGSLWGMGWHNNQPTRSITPTKLVASGVTDLYVNNGDVWFVKHEGALKAWGGGLYGQQGHGTAEENNTYSLETHTLTNVKAFEGGPEAAFCPIVEPEIITNIEYVTEYVDREVIVTETVEVPVEKIVIQTEYVEVEKIVEVEVEKIVTVEPNYNEMSKGELDALIKKLKKINKDNKDDKDDNGHGHGNDKDDKDDNGHGNDDGRYDPSNPGQGNYTANTKDTRPVKKSRIARWLSRLANFK